MMKCVIILVCTLIACLVSHSVSAQEAVTCGSVVKLIHKDTGNHLHSHSIAWGSGSGQQSVTANGSQNDQGSLWLIKESTKESSSCQISTPLACGSMIRLEHSATGKNLHSHLFKAPLSGNQEVSGFGEAGNGDTGDNWVVECEAGQKQWLRGGIVALRHADTGKYLYTADNVKFNAQNCGGGCPIMGQTEVSVASKKDSRTKWATGQGVYFPPKSN